MKTESETSTFSFFLFRELIYDVPKGMKFFYDSVCIRTRNYVEREFMRNCDFTKGGCLFFWSRYYGFTKVYVCVRDLAQPWRLSIWRRLNIAIISSIRLFVERRHNYANNCYEKAGCG